MYDPKFEKAVQRKMEELEFRPSESVWANIETAVSGDRRRRGIPLFWRFLIPALLLVAMSGAYYFGEKAGRKAGATATTALKAATGGENANPSETALKPDLPVGAKTTGSGAEIKAGAPAAGKVAGAKIVFAQVGVAKVAVAKVAGKTVVPAGVPDEEISEPAAFTGKGRPSHSSDPGIPGAAAWLYQPDLEDQRVAHTVSAAALRADKNRNGLTNLSQVKRPWEAGFAGGAGFDQLNRLDAGLGGNPASYSASSFYGLSRVGAKNVVSDPRPGASFYAGIYFQKPLSDRWTFHTGLNLHYYSTSVSIGQQVSVIASPAASLLNQTTLAAAPAPLVYTVGNTQTYVNRYYMLELPVSLQYRINRSKLLPVFIEGGGSVSRLMSANAIFYNPSTGLYLKSESVLNKMQFNVSSALLVGLPLHGIRIQAGPELQYGLTPLVNGQGLGDQHFLYGGIRLVVLPGRR
jgi:hypothetical protein